MAASRHQAHQEERSRTAVIMVTMHDNPAYLRRQCGGSGRVLLKDVQGRSSTRSDRWPRWGIIESQMPKGCCPMSRRDGAYGADT